MCFHSSHEFTITYKGQRGIALRCKRCGKTAEFKKQYKRKFQWLNFVLCFPLWYLSYSLEPFGLCFLFMLLAIALVWLVMPMVYGCILKVNPTLQEKMLEGCNGSPNAPLSERE